MRLIDTHTHLLLEPWKAAGKEYAILSHTWGADEVVFQEWEQVFPSGAIKGQCPHAARGSGIEAKAGFRKVVQACEQARRDAIRWLWCDTVCINKESSAELSEAINSMFKWYSDARICYVYLTDVTFPDQESHLGVFAGLSNVQGWFLHANNQKQAKLFHDFKSRFMGSRWWTRGWTLQELIAPETVVFFSVDWTPLGRKSDLASWIAAMTEIHRKVLEDRASIPKFSVAQRMSWAAARVTTVVEDMAYCLLGIFGITMPMLYGEGHHAFRKLQEEIIKVSDDQSIFAWHVSEASGTSGIVWTGAFATSPSQFRLCGSVIYNGGVAIDSIPYSLTNMGVKLTLSAIPISDIGPILLRLNCSVELLGRDVGRKTEQSGCPVRRRLPIWLMVRVVRGATYERGHLSTTKFCLQETYAHFMRPKSYDLFLAIPRPMSMLGQDLACEEDAAHCRPHSGITAAVGFGVMRKISRAYLDMWSPVQFSATSIGSRAPSSCSHEMVCAGNLIVVISVFWDDLCKPSKRFHSTFCDNDIKRDLMAQLDESSGSNSTQELEHHGIRSKHKQSMVHREDAVPLVLMDDETLQDSNGRPEVVVNIIFSQKP